MEVRRLFDIPQHQLEKFPREDALVVKVNDQWVKHSTQDLVDKAHLVSKGLLKLGIRPGDKVALIVTMNRPEWNMMDIGILQIGAIDVPLYPTASETDWTFIMNDSEVKLCFVSDAELYKKVMRIKGNVPTLRDVYTFEKVERAKNWSEVLELGKSGDQAGVEKLKAQVKEDDLATLIYTSGTTGVPKGVMLSHRNIVSNALASIVRLPVDENTRALSFLPVCHSYERMAHYLYILAGVSIYFAEDMDHIGDNLREVKPHVFTAVPRLLEKVFDKIVAKGSELTGIKRSLFFWALRLGERYELHGANGPWYAFQLKIAGKLIFSKWREALGGNVRVVASGASALQPRLARIFSAAGIPIMEGYGLTETSPAVAVSCEKDNGMMFGTVGRPLGGMQVKIAADGEILVKGPNIMMGYYKRPDLTGEVIDKEGWFHTGDIGVLVDGQFLKITDRKKEIFKTSGGKYIAPQVMENKFKESRFIEQVMVIGENRKHPAALIVPSFEYLKKWCEENQIICDSREELIRNKNVREAITREIEECNKQFGHWEMVKKFELLPKEWTIDSGELTPTLKLKRKEIMKRCQGLVEKIYAEE